MLGLTAGSPGPVVTLNYMTKQQLIEAVSADTNLAKRDVKTVAESILETIATKLEGNERVDLRGFGSFVIKDKKARQGHPRTGDTIEIPAKRDAAFKASKELSRRRFFEN